jgi:hypothetical protein
MGLLIKLQNGDTTLKSLKFGNDTPGGGNSNQPFIQTPIPEAISDPSPLESDFLLRGGINAPKTALEDVKRLTKYMFSKNSPSGYLFIAKQNLLSRVAVKTEAANGLSLAYAGGTLNEGIYTPLSTLAQAGVGFAGIHLNKQGIDPTGLIPSLSIKDYGEVVWKNNFNQNDNRLENLLYGKIYRKIDSEKLYSYGGGPGSILGVGRTNINIATDPNGSPIRTGINGSWKDPIFYRKRGDSPYYLDNILIGSGNTPSVSFQYASQTNTSLTSLFGQEDFINVYDGKDTLPWTPSKSSLTQYYKSTPGSWTQQDFLTVSSSRPEDIFLPDFRTKLNLSGSDESTFLSISPDYTTYNVENKFNLGNPGQKGNIRNYKNGKSRYGSYLGATDKITAFPIYKSDISLSTEQVAQLNDIIPFKIDILNNEDQPGGPYKKRIHFRAFIDSFSDAYDANWDPISYMGRGEKFYKYKGFDRKISMAFTVAAQSKEEILPMYQKLNFLASSLAPEYLLSGYMAGNLSFITIGGYLRDQPGIITSLTFDIPEESPWEIAIDEKGEPDNTISQVPHIIRVTGLTFIPIHEFRPSKLTWKEQPPGTTSVILENPGPQHFISLTSPEGTSLHGVTNPTPEESPEVINKLPIKSITPPPNEIIPSPPKILIPTATPLPTPSPTTNQIVPTSRPAF